MANAVRPPLLRSSNERQTRLNFLPVSRDDALQQAQRNNNNTPVATRRTSKSGPLLALADDDRSVKQLTHTPNKPPPPARTSSRKRPATALEDDATDTRPPTKITVTQPHGELLRITNGVAAPLGIDADDVPSARSTPRPGSSGKLAAPPAVPAPASTASSTDKRSLRSHDGGSRLKSDLAVYFSNYDDIIAGVPKEDEFLDIDTPIYIVDEPIKPKTPEPTRSSLSPTRSRKARPSSPSRHASDASIPLAPSSTSFTVLDYASIANAITRNDGEDPLADSVFFTQHRRAERKEKQLRNIEKERAMHEKVQLERLLDGLQGPDWLKVMGITGVTDGERKDWEAKRDYFVREVEALVDKFRVWKEEEKRLRAEKEAALAAREDDEEEDGEETEDSDNIVVNGRDAPPPRQQPKEPEPQKPRRPPRPHGFLLPFVPPEPAAPFSSFYAKPHLRAAALGKHRHGRNASAFGQPIPDFVEREFELPDDFIDPQFLRDNARQRRRRKRESGVNTGTGTSAH
ncbi:hypothetical protein AA0113_g6076 [Alternaria arborescens]|uniref:Something about silencing protein 4 domain-containing protein n=1 Tax=Alternaria arborescens TaxID=156630 RepID=A0A4Q4S178_9PLEO|nr:hypothetical protein AA0111_g5239 [Alternaria arborescens]RYN33744.1 hypothetical protein AA0112_g5555 [Alternaria arborescens]RYO30965.1 hypothetical protein AA0111_g5239 [Alternaria arborescens]RYO63501.1 hypothetical protein AA0113_g6076 [Alternaria arborescens]